MYFHILKVARGFIACLKRYPDFVTGKCLFPYVRYLELLYCRISKAPMLINTGYAAQLRQPIKKFISFVSLKTLRLYTGLFKFELDHYLTNVARVKSRYWG